MATEQELFDLYQNKFKLVYADLVATIGNKPQEIIFELEACLSHMGVAKTTSTSSIADTNIDRAYGHIQRATLDAVKLLWVTLKERAQVVVSDEAVRRYCSNCSEGKLLQQYSLAENLAINARRSEVQNTGISPNGSVDQWYEAVLAFKAFIDMVDYDKVASFQTFRFWHSMKQHSAGFVVGVLSSTLVAIACWKYLPPPDQPNTAKQTEDVQTSAKAPAAQTISPPPR